MYLKQHHSTATHTYHEALHQIEKARSSQETLELKKFYKELDDKEQEVIDITESLPENTRSIKSKV